MNNQIHLQSSKHHLSHPKYRPDIDGLRAIAVLSVVAFHAFPNWFKGGFIGVDIFFVISGFLISTIIFENLEKGTFSFAEFYSRRIRRIFPALILVIMATLAFGWLVLISEELNQLGKHVAAGAGFISNIILWGEAGYFDNSAETKPLLHLWSLGIEEQFYIIWPFILWLAWKRNFNLLILTSIAIIVSFYLNFKQINEDPIATFYLPHTRFWELLSGSMLAWFFVYKNDFISNLKLDDLAIKVFFRKKINIDGSTLSNALATFGVLFLMYGLLKITKDLAFPGFWAIIPVFGALLIILAGQQAWINRNILSNKILVWFGLISFPLYLWHWPILSYLRIIENETPHRDERILAVLLSILLAWLTVKFIEKPLRFGKAYSKIKVIILSVLMFLIGLTGLLVKNTDFSASHTYDKSAIERKNTQYIIDNSIYWYKGKSDWLFLGNAYDKTVAKTTLGIIPTAEQINSVNSLFDMVSKVGEKHGIKTVLIVGPNKSTIYPEYLPESVTPSKERYSSFFIEKLKSINNLVVYDPTSDLLKSKYSEGALYWMTDTHWNFKGAFLTYSGFSRLVNEPIPEVSFKQGSVHSGDLIGISKLSDFPLHSSDNWDVVWKENPTWKLVEIPNEKNTSFGSIQISVNDNPLSNKYVWVVGDSFTGALKQYFNATYKEVRYHGHWSDKLANLAEDLEKAERKPDMVVIVRVERSF